MSSTFGLRSSATDNTLEQPASAHIIISQPYPADPPMIFPRIQFHHLTRLAERSSINSATSAVPRAFRQSHVQTVQGEERPRSPQPNPITRQ